jgi:hypothetical protein
MIQIVVALLVAADPCRATTTPSARPVLDRAASAIGLNDAAGRVLHIDGFDVTNQAFQSDRPGAPPFLAAVTAIDSWLDARTGIERTTSRTTLGGPQRPATTIGGAAASYLVRDTSLVPSPSTHGELYATRPLDVWTVLLDWRDAPDVHTVATCEYRDYPRLVLSRRGAQGEERLFIDAKSGYPVKLDRLEPDYLWGTVHAEYVYSTWQSDGALRWPVSSFRVIDGSTDVTRTYGTTRLVPLDSAPTLALPAQAVSMDIAPPAFLVPTNPDTVRVGANTFLLHNVGFNETVTLVRDTVYVFDATQGEVRARADSAWIGRLFPGKHPITVVVTDIAWPHVAGVRFWVATGATIVTHRANRAFLQRVIDRRWTASPDLLERRRAKVTPRLRTVDDSLRLGGGDVTLFAIDGVASEAALAAFLATDRFLWASDYVQTLAVPTQYLDETSAAVERMHVSPLRVAAEHLRLSSWEDARRLQQRGQARP